MPVIPPIVASRYDTVNTVITSAQARLNAQLTTLQAVSGSLLNNTDSNSQQFTNNGWRKMQDHLADRGYARLVNECIISQFPVAGSHDPASQAWISWTGCYDGANFFTTPALPDDFTHPLKVWERWSNANSEFGSTPMEKILDGLPAVNKTSRIRFWEWRGDAIYMPGSQNIEDLRIRYVKYLSDFADEGNTRWFQQPVPIMRSSDSLSWFVCAEVASARGDLALAETFQQNALSTLSHIFNLDVRADQRVNIRRQPRTGRGFGRNYY